MEEYKASKFVPDFILADKNGYAIAKAIEIAMNNANQTIERGIACLTDVSSMPEWRLDEMAWETDCLYDYTAAVEIKRQWIKDARLAYKIRGTADAIKLYVTPYFDGAVVEEAHVYGGEPFHFRVIIDGEPGDSNETWAYKAIEKAKNVRSILDSVSIARDCGIAISVTGGITAYEVVPTTGTIDTGMYPPESE